MAVRLSRANEQAIRTLQDDFNLLQRESGIISAADPYEFMRHLPHDKLGDLCTSLFTLIVKTVAVSDPTSSFTPSTPAITDQPAAEKTTADDEEIDAAPPDLAAYRFSIEVTTPEGGLPRIEEEAKEEEDVKSASDESVADRDPMVMSFGARSSISADGLDCVNDYTIVSTIGMGQCGRVVLALYKDKETEPRAIKIVPRDRLLQKRAEKDPNVIQVIQREIAIQKKLRHRHIVALYEVIDDPEEGLIYLVMQYIENGPILKFEGHKCQVLAESQVKKYMRQLTSGLQYLEKHNIVHRDIKPDNILISKDDDAYIADFGMSEMMGGNIVEFVDADMQRGTPAFMSPEVFRGDSSGTPSDVWSLGVTCYAMLFGALPFKGDTWSELSQSVQNDEVTFPADVNPAWADAIKGMLEKNPFERSTLTQLRRHPLLREGRRESSVCATPRSPSMEITEGEFEEAFTARSRIGISPKLPSFVLDDSQRTPSKHGSSYLSPKLMPCPPTSPSQSKSPSRRFQVPPALHAL